MCGSDGKIYGNDCLLEKAACESKSEITQKTGGDCEVPVFKLLERQNQLQKDKEDKLKRAQGIDCINEL